MKSQSHKSFCGISFFVTFNFYFFVQHENLIFAARQNFTAQESFFFPFLYNSRRSLHLRDDNTSEFVDRRQRQCSQMTSTESLFRFYANVDLSSSKFNCNLLQMSNKMTTVHHRRHHLIVLVVVVVVVKLCLHEIRYRRSAKRCHSEVCQKVYFPSHMCYTN